MDIQATKIGRAGFARNIPARPQGDLAERGTLDFISSVVSFSENSAYSQYACVLGKAIYGTHNEDHKNVA